MTSCCHQHQMRWSGATGAIARGKRVSTGCGRKRRSVRALRWICGVKPKPKAGNKPLHHFILHGLAKPGSSATVSTYALVRYADDVAIFCPTHAEAMEAKTLLAQWLAPRGLRWSEAKTHIRHLTEGFDFLGFHIRHYPAPTSSRSGYKLLITPSIGSITQIKRKLKGLWRRHVGSP